MVCRVGGSEIWLGGLDDKERTEKILGQEYATLYFNECSQIAYNAVLMARTRLAQKTTLTNRAYYDCNPPGSRHWTAQVFVAKKDPASKPPGALLPNPDNFAAMVMNPYGKHENRAPEYIKELEALPERQKNRFLLAKYTAELDNALWTPDSFRHVKPRPRASASA
jgi:Terminase large subunit, T4likevirus-type, N-terminal